MKEDRESWLNFFTWLKGRGLAGVRLIIGDKCLGMLESIPVVFPEAKYQRCTVHFYRNVFTVTPKAKMKQVTLMLKAIHAQESKEAVQEKAVSIAAKLREMKLLSAAKKVEESVGETLTYMDFPRQLAAQFPSWIDVPCPYSASSPISKRQHGEIWHRRASAHCCR